MLLENIPLISDQPGVTMPSSLVEMEKDNKIHLHVINPTSLYFKLPNQTAIATVEIVSDHEIELIAQEFHLAENEHPRTAF